MISTRRSVLILTLLALGLAAGLNLWPKRGIVSFSPAHPLSSLAPQNPADWSVRDLPLGPTEISANETLKTLDLSDYFYKDYRRGAMDVRIYVAYWRPGQIDPRVVWAHQPDICWIGEGGTIVKKDDSRILPADDKSHSLPARFRIFEFPRGREEVVFWHLVGKRLSEFSLETNSSVGAQWRHFANSLRLSTLGLRPREQLVVRISTNQTIDRVFSSPLWPNVVRSFRDSGIFVPGGPADSGSATN